MKNLTVLRSGMKAEAVGEWQTFLTGLKLFTGVIDNDFGPKTLSATQLFQAKYKLKADGIVGPGTWAKAIALGFNLGLEDNFSTVESLNFPPKPDFEPLVSKAQREALFGKITFVVASTAANKEAIKITNDFQKKNIVIVDLPQLAKATGGKFKRMSFHRLAVPQLKAFFEEIETAGLLDLILSFGGGYMPRFIRGGRSVLSNHAYGTAFDINMTWNGLNKTPALKGTRGSVRELVQIAHKHGFYWGGHFSRADGMHFEIAKIIK